MLIYNHNKEFIGIDEEELRHFGYQSLDELFSECRDFADLFVKKPGYIHNFKNFKWIDYLLHADADDAKVIINARGHEYSCDLLIKPMYLLNTPDQPAYVITIQHIKSLGTAPKLNAAPADMPEPVFAPVSPMAAAPVTGHLEEPAFKKPTAGLPSLDDIEPMTLVEPDPMDVPLEALNVDDVYTPAPAHPKAPEHDFNQPLDIGDVFIPSEAAKKQAEEEERKRLEELKQREEQLKEFAPVSDDNKRPMLGDYIHLNKEEREFLDNLKTDRAYVYDPQIAADELGLPVDLIEEFIGDFIQQAYEFKDELFTSSAAADRDNIRNLSHKLKGVAANLRVEDAFEVLSVINTSDNLVEIEANLKQFYYIIAKLDPNSKTPQISASSTETEHIEAETSLPQPEDELYAFEPLEETSVQPLDEIPVESQPHPVEADDEIYSFETRETTADAPLKTASKEDNDLYDFGFKDEQSFSASEFSETATETSLPEPEAELPEPSEPIQSDYVAPQRPEQSKQPNPVPPMHYDRNKAQNELGIPGPLLQEFIKDFMDEANNRSGDFEDAINHNEPAKWQQAAIILKGVSDNLRMTDISALLQTINHTTDVTEARTTLVHLYNCIDQLQQ